MSFGSSNRYAWFASVRSVAWAVLMACCTAAWSAPPPSHAGAPGSAKALSGITGDSTTGWAALSAQQRTALAPLQNDWSGMDSDSRQKWLILARRFPSMPPAERARVQARMTEWARTPAAERGKARLRYQRAKEISPQVRQAQWNAYQSLPEEQRRKLAEEAQKRHHRNNLSAGTTGKGLHPPGIAERSTGTKSNLVADRTGESALKSVAPSIVQARPGATTNLVSRRLIPPAHLRPGWPKIAATPESIDSATLLPMKGPQGIRSVPAEPGPASTGQPAHP